MGYLKWTRPLGKVDYQSRKYPDFPSNVTPSSKAKPNAHNMSV
jgi:hypothetical protein